MGKITVATYLTLDGVLEHPAWTAPYWEAQLSDYQDQAQREATALLLGRVTFEQFAAAWPESPDEGAPFMNGIGKYVPTTTIREPSWGAVFLHDDVAARITKLREEHNLLVYGSARLTRFLFQHGLVDEYREMVFPLVLGKGRRLFDGAAGPLTFTRLESARTIRNVLLNTYRR